jgi:nucleoside-diphosphate-sugar epimerase
MTTLVIGSTGYMGRHLMAGLAAAGLPAAGASSSDGTGIHPDTGLLPDSFAVPAGTGAVVYMAQSPRYRDPEQASHVLAVNVVSAVRAAVAARKAGVRRFVYVSTGTVYAPSFEPLTESAPVRGADWYSLSKIQGEQAIQMFRDDMDVHVVRPFGVYGPGQTGRLVPNLMASIQEGRTITLQGRRDDPSDADGLRISLCHVDDATRILIHLIQHGGPACLNLAGEQAASIRTLATLLGELLGRPPVLAAATALRNFDLVADIGLLRQSQPMVFTPLRQGLATLMDKAENVSC